MLHITHKRAIKYFIIAILIGIASYASASVAHAAPTCNYISEPLKPYFCANNEINTDASSVINTITNFFVGLMGLALVITILISAIQIISAGANLDQLSAAKKRLGTAALSLGLLVGLRALLALIGV